MSDRGTPGFENIEYSSGMILLLRNVTISSATGNFIIPCAVDGIARIFLTPGLSIIPLKGESDLTTMKFIQADVDRIIPLEYSMFSKPGVPRSDINQVTKEKIQVAIHPEYPEQTIAIGSTLTEEGRKEIYGLLRRHLDVFTWKPVDMTRVPRHIAEHRLNVREGCLPIRQKKRGQAPERNKAISEKVKKLVEADIMKEVHYHSWLSNPVMVKKQDNSWRMCVDFKDLNKACPKDGYLLPEID
nr:reverse transcriptase domain-containing protein [Tanacetum cinerariifolium]